MKLWLLSISSFLTFVLIFVSWKICIIYVFFYLKREAQHIPPLKQGKQGGDVIVVLPLSAVVKNSLTAEVYANALFFQYINDRTL